MEKEGLPPEFIETVRTGWWTTCMEILPAKERSRASIKRTVRYNAGKCTTEYYSAASRKRGLCTFDTG